MAHNVIEKEGNIYHAGEISLHKRLSSVPGEGVYDVGNPRKCRQ